MHGDKKWYALYTRCGWEKRVAEYLTRRKIENYYPLKRLVRQSDNSKRIVHEPLFNSYVFVRIPEKEILLLRQIVGVINLVYWLGKPAIIRDREIEIIKKVLTEYRNIKLEKTSRELVIGQDGQVFSITNKTIKIILPSLGYLIIAEGETINEEISIRAIATQTDLHSPIHAVK